MFGLLVPKTTKEWQVRLPGDRCYGSPWQRYPLETDRHSELKMAIPNPSQFVSWKYLIPYLSSPSKSAFLFVSSLFNWSPKSITANRNHLKKDLLRQSTVQFLKSLFCSCRTFDIHIPVKSSVGLVIVSRLHTVSFTFFQYCSSKSFCGPEKVAVIQAVFCGEGGVYVCAEEKGPGDNQADTNALCVPKF